jgi:hypothetical protein
LFSGTWSPLIDIYRNNQGKIAAKPYDSTELRRRSPKWRPTDPYMYFSL